MQVFAAAAFEKVPGGHAVQVSDFGTLNVPAAQFWQLASLRSADLNFPAEHVTQPVVRAEPK